MNLHDLAEINLPEIRQITDRISYVPASMNPLSSDIGIVRGNERLYLYDTGSSLPCLKYLQSLSADKAFVISHFHGDHTWWLSDHKHGEHGVANDDNISTDYDSPKYSSLYVSPQSARYISANLETTIITDSIVIDDGIRLEIKPLPCTHCKGSLMLIVDNKYAFLGDATYANKVDGVTFYNSQLLKSEIDILENTDVDFFLLSHDAKFVRPKAVVLRQLQTIYSHRTPGDSLIRL